MFDIDLVSILLWTKPVKSAIALFSVNVICWFLIRQRPLFVLAIVLLIYYLKYLWVHRIRPEVLVDPPDHESWMNLSAYDFQHAMLNFLRGLWTFFIDLRGENHLAWVVLSTVIWMILAKLGTYFGLLTLIFIVSNGAFVVGPFIKYIPKGTTESINDFFPSNPTPTPPASIHESSMRDSPVLDESLTPYSIGQMPGHDESEDEFMFDNKHFESSSSTSSTSNSFELINI